MISKIRPRSGRHKLVLNENIVHTTVGIVCLSIWVIFLLRPAMSALPTYSAWIGVCILGSCYFVLNWGWQLFWLVRLEFRRTALLSSESWLALLQPENPAYDEVIPSIIKVQVKPIYMVFLLLVWSIPWLPILIVSLETIWPLFIFLLLVVVFPVFIDYLSWQSTIGVTDSGFTKRQWRRMKTMTWADMRLFTCYRLPRLIGKQPVLYYELSSQTTRITWMWVVDARSVFAPWRPTLPDEQYQRQMQALTALVKEKTGLPLYDLSEPWLQRKQGGTPKE